MVTEIQLLTREAGIIRLIEQAPIKPEQHSHTYDDEIDVVWQKGEQIIHISLEPGATQARWLSWHPEEYPDIKNRFQYLDVTNPESWNSLFSELQC